MRHLNSLSANRNNKNTFFIKKKQIKVYLLCKGKKYKGNVFQKSLFFVKKEAGRSFVSRSLVSLHPKFKVYAYREY